MRPVPLICALLLLLHVRPGRAASPVCPAPPVSRSLTLVHEFPAAALPDIHRYLHPPALLRLLFASSVARVLHRSRFLYTLHTRTAQLSVQVRVAETNATVVFVHHDPAFYSVDVKGATLTLRILATALILHLVPPPNTGPRTASFAAALLHDFRARIALVLSTVHCPGAIAHPTGWCNSQNAFGVVGAPQRRAKLNRLRLEDALVNPRVVSQSLGKAKSDKFAKGGINFLMVMFGQLVDHDIVLTPSGRISSVQAPFENKGKWKWMPFLRSDLLTLPVCCDHDYQPKDGLVFNAVTAFLDASVVYGSSVTRMMALRSGLDGKLLMKKSNFGWRLPKNHRNELRWTVHNANDHANTNLFAAGDIRANENPILLALQTLFAREHNRICDVLKHQLQLRHMPKQTDEWLFQQARRVVMAELQNIAFEEFVPAMIGGKGLKQYHGYNPNVDASMDLLFTTAAYRWGHSAIRETLWVVDKEGKTRSKQLSETFFNPTLFSSIPIEDWLRGAMMARAMKVDLEHADSVREFLFSPGLRGRLDLMALNIQRGRDHALESYLDARQRFDLTRDLTDIPTDIRKKLLQVYNNQADKIDVLVGGLAEKTHGDGMLGKLFTRVVTDQFTRLRDGDRHYYKNVVWGEFMEGLDIVERVKNSDVTLADVIIANTDIQSEEIHEKGAMISPSFI